jgi:hypothetical protein
MPNLIKISIENPLKTWWKARRYFKFPYMRFYACKWGFGDMLPVNRNTLAKWVQITLRDVWWKDKWANPSHEYNPIIKVVFFRYFEMGVVFTNKVDDMIYWESMLDFLYYSKNIRKAVDNNVWHSEIRGILTPYDIALNKRGRRRYESKGVV